MIVICGPTASGKTALSLELAMQLSATGAQPWILSADAFAVYRRMDIGTAKPTQLEQTMFPHFGIDLVDASENFTMPDWLNYANALRQRAEAEGHELIVAGGTGLYINAYVDRLVPPPEFLDVRAELEANEDTRAMFDQLVKLDPSAAKKIEPDNRRRIVRALEVCIGSGQTFSSFGAGISAFPPTDDTLIYLEMERSELDGRINTRLDAQIDAGLVSEVADLTANSLGWSRNAQKAVAYVELHAYLRGDMTLDEAVEAAKLSSRQLARRQQRWFRRDPRMIKVNPSDSEAIAEAAEIALDEFRNRQGNPSK